MRQRAATAAPLAGQAQGNPLEGRFKNRRSPSRCLPLRNHPPCAGLCRSSPSPLQLPILCQFPDRLAAAATEEFWIWELTKTTGGNTNTRKRPAEEETAGSKDGQGVRQGMWQEKEEGVQALVVSAHDLHCGGANRTLAEGSCWSWRHPTVARRARAGLAGWFFPGKLGDICGCMADL